jgi:hypothetical protein
MGPPFYPDEQTFDGGTGSEVPSSGLLDPRRWAMADAGLFIGFGDPVRGRESQAVELFNEAVGWFTSLQEEGEIESFEPVFLEPHGGDLGGFILLRGEAEKLATLRVSEEFAQFILRVGLHVENVGVVGADLAERLQSLMAYYTEQIGAIA